MIMGFDLKNGDKVFLRNRKGNLLCIEVKVKKEIDKITGKKIISLNNGRTYGYFDYISFATTKEEWNNFKSSVRTGYYNGE